MSLKQELETWASALQAYDEEDFEKSLDLFSRIADSSKILTNMGLIYATLGEHEAAVENFNSATGLDKYLAVAYFQCGVSNFLLTRYDLALNDFEEALLYLRGNQAINYDQLGLKFKLYSAEVLFNKGLSLVYMGREQEGLAEMEEARREKATEDHGVIDDAIADRGEGYTVFSIPVGVLYRPPEKKLINAKTKDYMGTARLIAAADERDAFTTFSGSTLLQKGMTPSGAPVDRPASEPTPAPALGNLGRANTATARLQGEDAPRGGLTRNATTINVISKEERDTRLSNGKPGGPGITRNASIAGPGGPRAGGPTRGLSVRAPNGGPAGAGGLARSPSARSPDAGPNVRRSPIGEEDKPRPPAKGRDEPSRLTEIYDDYIGQYDEEVPDLPPIPPEVDQKRSVAAWARNNGNATANPNARRGPSSYGTPASSSYAPSSYGGGSVRRKLTRRTTYGSKSRQSQYEEEEEGYVSGDYEDGPFELVKIRVKLHYKDDVRGMALTPEMPFDEFMDRVASKFGKALSLKFKDEDGGKVSLRDDSDYELAIETAREHAKGRPEGKLEVWCTDG